VTHRNGRTTPLFELTAPIDPEPEVVSPEVPVWTHHKARLIERYLRLFVYITKHGTYIDGFAGPQAAGNPETWAAKLVLESSPYRLRNFYLFERNRRSYGRLQAMRKTLRPSARGEPKRNIEVVHGDFNREVQKVLKPEVIKDTEATFCLLDQRTFECEWATVEALAKHKRSGHKIELFYFLANSWIERAFAAVKKPATRRQLVAWWGREEGLPELERMDRSLRMQAFVHRLRELGYKSVKAWPIYGREEGRQTVMYFMVHATDHPDAPGLMSRAYRKAVLPLETKEQLDLEMEGFERT
jgi:three-Cys-motif partner protein